MKLARSAYATTAFIGAVSNLALAAYLWGVLHSFVWEPVSEWEGYRFTLTRDGARLVCTLFSTYFAAACAICIFGFIGIIRGIPTFVRIYRNYVIGDFAFCTLFAVLASSAAVDPATRSQVCEQVSRRPDLLRDVIDLGLTLENCEQWFEHGLMAFMAIFLLRTVIRIHFIVALSNLYARLVRMDHYDSSCAYDGDEFSQMERVYILPHPPTDLQYEQHCLDDISMEPPIYPPVQLAQVSPKIAHQLRASATEAWISHVPLPYYALARVPSYGARNELTQFDIRTPPSVGPIHLENESH